MKDLGPDIPRDRYFETVVEPKVVQHVKLGWFRVFPDFQDHLGQVQGHRQPGVGRVKDGLRDPYIYCNNYPPWGIVGDGPNPKCGVPSDPA